MFAEMVVSIATVLKDPNEDFALKVFIVLILLALAGVAWLLGRLLWRMLRAPFDWLAGLYAWRTVAGERGWMMKGTRRLAGNLDGSPWRMSAHLAGAFIQVYPDEDDAGQPSHAIWAMRELDWPGRVQCLPRARDAALRKESEAAASASGASEASSLAGALPVISLGASLLGWDALNMAAELAIKERTGEALALLDPVPAGSADFQREYVVRSDNPALAQRLITPEVESLVRQLHDAADPVDPLGMHYAKGVLVLRQSGDFSRARRAETFCRLGLALAGAGALASASAPEPR